MSQPTVEMNSTTPNRSSQTDRIDNGGYPVAPSLGLLSPLGCAGFTLSETPVGLYHVPLRSELSPLLEEVMDGVAAAAKLPLTMRVGFLYGKANANIFAVKPMQWPCNGFLREVMEGVLSPNSCTHVCLMSRATITSSAARAYVCRYGHGRLGWSNFQHPASRLRCWDGLDITHKHRHAILTGSRL